MYRCWSHVDIKRWKVGGELWALGARQPIRKARVTLSFTQAAKPGAAQGLEGAVRAQDSLTLLSPRMKMS